MLIGQEEHKKSNGDLFTRSFFNFDHVAEANHELRQEIGNGMTKGKEMRHVARIPVELADCDPLVRAAAEGDSVCLRLAIAKYPFLKVCDGRI